MKRIVLTLMAAVGLTGPFVAALNAQSVMANAEIPFSFVVANRRMPAGNYRISRLTGGATVFALNGEQGASVLANFSGNQAGRPQHPSLTFACYGKECVLAGIAPPDSETAYCLSPAAMEKHLSRRLGMTSMVAIKMNVR